MRSAVRPTLLKAQELVPVGKRSFGKGWQERGGTTKRDIRIKTAKDAIYETVAMVGVGGKKGKVGWRAHFQEYGPTKGGIHKRRSGPNKGKTWIRTWKFTPFMRPAEAATKDRVTAVIIASVQEAIKRDLE